MNLSTNPHLCAAALATAAIGVLAIVWACGNEGLSGKPAADPAAQPAPSPACAKDTDCKGDRICQNGNCVSPR